MTSASSTQNRCRRSLRDTGRRQRRTRHRPSGHRCDKSRGGGCRRPALETAWEPAGCIRRMRPAATKMLSASYISLIDHQPATTIDQILTNTNVCMLKF